MSKFLFDWTALDRIVEILDEPSINEVYVAYRRTTSKALKVANLMVVFEIFIVIGAYVATLYGSATTEVLLGIFIGMTLFEIIHSYIVNRFLFYRDEAFIVQIAPRMHELLAKKNLSSELVKSFSFVTSQLNAHHLGQSRLVRDIGDAITFLTISLVVFVSGRSQIWILVLLAYLIVLCTSAVVFRSVASRIFKALKTNSIPNRVALAARIAIPSISNIGSHVLFRFLIPYAILSSQYELQLVIALLFNLLGTLWSSVSFIVMTKEASKEVIKMKEMLVTLEQKYIINNNGYWRQRQLCKPKRAVAAEGLVLKKFKPIDSAGVTRHVYTYTFNPGVYQLNGVNGVGKTTLLKAITIPENYATMYSGGSISFGGSCVYQSQTLHEHRDKFVYIGHLSPVPPVKLLPKSDAKKYPLIAELHKNVSARTSGGLSEGEQNVILTYEYFSSAIANGVNVIAVDEALSRIYNGKDKPLRNEVMRFIADKTKQAAELVVIIVDHQTKVSKATQLLMTKTEISTLR